MSKPKTAPSTKKSGIKKPGSKKPVGVKGARVGSIVERLKVPGFRASGIVSSGKRLRRL